MGPLPSGFVANQQFKNGNTTANVFTDQQKLDEANKHLCLCE